MLELIKAIKVGIIPCNGEEICEGTLTRFASRKVLDKLRPEQYCDHLLAPVHCR